MILRHVRQNAVAYLALVVALSTGSAYAAAQIANGSVTTKKLANNAVVAKKVKDASLTGADLKDGSVTAADLKAGVVPFDGAGSAAMLSGATQTTVADFTGQGATTFSSPGATHVYLRYFAASYGINCSAGSATIAMELDGTALPNTQWPLIDATTAQAGSRPVELVAYVPVGKGNHTASLAVDCPTGNYTMGFINNATWTVLRTSE